jgi:hypothetical protein
MNGAEKLAPKKPPRTELEYVLIVRNSAEQLSAKVSAMLNEGWFIQGQHTITNGKGLAPTQYCQALTKGTR